MNNAYNKEENIVIGVDAGAVARAQVQPADIPAALQKTRLEACLAVWDEQRR